MFRQRVNLNIPVSHFQNVLSWDKPTIDALVEKAIELVVKIGLRLDEDKEGIYLKEAESKGAKIDWENQAVMFTKRQIEETIEIMRKTCPVPDPLRPLSICEQGRHGKFSVGNGANLLFNWNKWDVKRPSTADLVELSQWVQGYDCVALFQQPVMLQDVDLQIEPLYSYYIIAKHCRKEVRHAQPTEPAHVKYLSKMAALLKSIEVIISQCGNGNLSIRLLEWANVRLIQCFTGLIQAPLM